MLKNDIQRKQFIYDDKNWESNENLDDPTIRIESLTYGGAMWIRIRLLGRGMGYWSDEHDMNSKEWRTRCYLKEKDGVSEEVSTADIIAEIKAIDKEEKGR